MSTKIRWGILGPGRIAHSFAEGLKAIPNAELYAVGSRSQKNADAFGDKFEVEHRYASYEALVQDADVDVIYIATPHPHHADNACLCLNHGKAVLCEKPFTLNRWELERVIETAQKNQCFLMEAMWTRFLPAIQQVRQWLNERRIGQLHLIQADFGFREAYNPKSRIYNPETGGGSLLDVGVYPISFASMMFGHKADRIASLAELTQDGVDDAAGIVLGYSEGGMAVITCAVKAETPQEAWLLGDEGKIEIPTPFWRSKTARLLPRKGDPVEATPPFEGNGYNYQALAVQECMEAGQLECPQMSWQESVTIMETMDALRQDWGVRYPSE